MTPAIVIYWSKADGAFVAEVPELPGCMADGPTYREALAAAEVVIGGGSKPRPNSVGRSRNRKGGWCSREAHRRSRFRL